MKEKIFEKAELDLYKRTMKYFKINTKSIEMINKFNQIQKIFFINQAKIHKPYGCSNS